MKAGSLDRVITLQTYDSAAVDDYGVPAPAWVDLATIRAQLVQGTTDEYLSSGGATDKTKYIFRVRWLDGVSTAGQVLYDGTTFNVKEIKEIGRRKGLELRCEALS